MSAHHMFLTLSLVDPPYGGIGTHRNKKNYKNSTVHMLDERFTYQNVEKELLYKYANNCCYSSWVTMVTMTSNSGVGVSKKNSSRKWRTVYLALQH